ncbi:MAG: hypothetical protein ABWY64_22635 [Tardiphaga sp.]
MTNPFEDLAEKQIAAPVKRKQAAMALRLSRSDRDAPMKPGAQEKAQLDRAIQVRLWRDIHRDEIEVIRAGAHGADFVALERELRALSIDGAEQLIAFVETSPLRQAPPDIRYVALATVDAAIMKLRLSNGYPPFDDSLPGEEPTAFEIIREYLDTRT